MKYTLSHAKGYKKPRTFYAHAGKKRSYMSHAGTVETKGRMGYYFKHAR